MKSKKNSLFTAVGLCPACALFILGGALSLAIPGKALASLPKNTVVRTIKVGSRPACLVCSPDGQFVYVGGNSEELYVIDATTNRLSSSFTVSGLDGAIFALAISSDGQTLYSPAIDFETLYVMSIATQSVTTYVTLNGFPTSEALTPDGTQLWIGISAGDSGVNGINIVDTANDQVNPTPIQLPGIPFSVVFTPDGTYAYVSYNANGVYSLALIDTASQTVVNSNVAGSSLHANTYGPEQLTMDPNGKELFVNEFTSVSGPDYTVTESVNTSNNKTKQVYSTAGTDYNVTVSSQNITPNGKYLYFGIESSESKKGTVVTVDTAQAQTVGQPVTVGVSPVAIAIKPNGRDAYVANESSNTVTVINITPE
ncbi:MAG: hypothetical protein WAK31_27010 [Chthoniobacterales bacterium]